MSTQVVIFNVNVKYCSWFPECAFHVIIFFAQHIVSIILPLAVQQYFFIIENGQGNQSMW